MNATAASVAWCSSGVAPIGPESMFMNPTFTGVAEGSAAVTAYTNADYNHLRPRHFLFIGTDRCYEALSFGEPVIRQFDTREEAYRWGLDRSE